jgi:uncharacterized RDD family membrane protein YckC
LEEEIVELPVPVDFEKEKKKNIRLAIGVASLGVVGFFAIYILSFLIMIYSPGWFFNLFPFPSFSENVVGFKGNLFLFSKSIEFKGRNFENPPEEKTTLKIFDGKSVSEPQEIKHFASLYSTEDKIYFFDKGVYRTFDGKNWEVFKNPAIGNTPKGAVGPKGIYILSTTRRKTELKLISENGVKQIRFPEDEMKEKMYVCSSKILCLGNELYLFYKNDDGLFCSKYDGNNWSQPDRFEDVGNYKALLFKDGILLFQMDFCKRKNITLRTYSNNSWSEPKTVTVPETSLHFDLMPAVFAEKPILYQQGLFSEKYYSIDEGQVSGPFKISSSFFFSLSIWKIILIAVLPAVIYFLLVFLISFFIGKFKLKRWRMDSKEYEFASLWRRFLANYIDTLITMAPFAAPAYFLFKQDAFFDNPFRFVSLFLFSMVSMVLVSYFYFSLLEGIWGKTIGKKICGIVVLKDNFTKCTISKGLLRNLLRIVDFFFYYLVGVVSMAGTMKWQRLGDIVAETVVVRDRRASQAPS